jgi:hypothetical protein
MVLSTEECVFLAEYVFCEGNRYTDLVQEQSAKKFPQTPVPYHNAVRRLIEKLHETGSMLDAEMRDRHDKKLWTFLTLCCGVHQNRCASWCKRKISGLQQCTKRSEKN